MNNSTTEHWMVMSVSSCLNRTGSLARSESPEFIQPENLIVQEVGEWVIEKLTATLLEPHFGIGYTQKCLWCGIVFLTPFLILHTPGGCGSPENPLYHVFVTYDYGAYETLPDGRNHTIAVWHTHLVCICLSSVLVLLLLRGRDKCFGVDRCDVGIPVEDFFIHRVVKEVFERECVRAGFSWYVHKFATTYDIQTLVGSSFDDKRHAAEGQEVYLCCHMWV
jgi:hypothetical protein